MKRKLVQAQHRLKSINEEILIEKSLLLILGLVCLGCHIEMPQIRWLKLQKFTSHSCGSWKSQIEVWEGWLVVKALFLLCRRPLALTWPFLWAGKVRYRSLVVYYGVTNSIELIFHPYNLMGFPSGSSSKEPTCQCRRWRRQEMWVQSLGQDDPLEEEMATHASIFAWKFTRTEEPGGSHSMQSQRVGRDWACAYNLI